MSRLVILIIIEINFLPSPKRLKIYWQTGFNLTLILIVAGKWLKYLYFPLVTLNDPPKFRPFYAVHLRSGPARSEDPVYRSVVQRYKL